MDDMDAVGEVDTKQPVRLVHVVHPVHVVHFVQ